jgi:hypothetical protein
MKKIATESGKGNEAICLLAILLSAPTNVKEIETDADRLIWVLASSSSSNNILTMAAMAEDELGKLFRRTHQCQLPIMPKLLQDAYANAGTVWRGTCAISNSRRHRRHMHRGCRRR